MGTKDGPQQLDGWSRSGCLLSLFSEQYGVRSEEVYQLEDKYVWKDIFLL